MRAFNISIHKDKEGKPVVRFPKLKEELTPPADRMELLDWIRKSSDSFLRKVKDKEELLGSAQR